MPSDRVDKLLAQWRTERPELDASGLALVVRIELLAKLIKRDTARRLAEITLKSWEYDVLSALRRQGAPFELPASRLARASLLSPGAVTTRIDRLEARGLVSRRPDPADGRGTLVRLTRAGKRQIDRAIHVRLEAAEECVAGLGQRERQAAERVLRKLLLDMAGDED